MKVDIVIYIGWRKIFGKYVNVFFVVFFYIVNFFLLILRYIIFEGLLELI